MYMDYHSTRWWEIIIRQIQERIKDLSKNIDKWQEELNLYRRIRAVITCDDDTGEQYSHDDEFSIEIIPDPKVQWRIKSKGERKSNLDERKEAFKKARIWHLDRIRSKRKSAKWRPTTGDLRTPFCYCNLGCILSLIISEHLNRFSCIYFQNAVK